MFPDRRHHPAWPTAFAILAKVLLFPLGIVIATVTVLAFACIGVVHTVRLTRWKVFGGTRPVLRRPEPDEPAT
jgi:hypothetical protein